MSAFAVGDVNNDWFPDAIVLDSTGGDSMSAFVAVAAACGSLTYRVPGMPERIVIADVNRDGFGDVVTYTRRGRIWALLGGGTSSVLQAAHQIGRGYGVAAGDFNGDRNVDLVTGGDRANGVILLLGHGDGTFARQPAIPVGGSWSDLHTGDFNQDGRADIVLARSNRLVVVPGRGTERSANRRCCRLVGCGSPWPI